MIPQVRAKYQVTRTRKRKKVRNQQKIMEGEEIQIEGMKKKS